MSVKIDIPNDKRKKIIKHLNQLLADSFDLQSQCKQAHWNVKGESFIALHELFDKIVAAASKSVDDIAERIMQLGGEANGTVRVAAKNSRLKEYPHGIASGIEHCEALSSALAEFSSNTVQAIEAIEEVGDPVTVDILTTIAGDIDKYVWFVEAHLPKY
jgi:starvation-inducible DNA-binding protein